MQIPPPVHVWKASPALRNIKAFLLSASHLDSFQAIQSIKRNFLDSEVSLSHHTSISACIAEFAEISGKTASSSRTTLDSCTFLVLLPTALSYVSQQESGRDAFTFPSQTQNDFSQSPLLSQNPAKDMQASLCPSLKAEFILTEAAKLGLHTVSVVHYSILSEREDPDEFTHKSSTIPIFRDPYNVSELLDLVLQKIPPVSPASSTHTRLSTLEPLIERNLHSATARALARATGSCCLGHTLYDPPRRKSVDVGGVARAHTNAQLSLHEKEAEVEAEADGLSDLLTELFRMSQKAADGVQTCPSPYELPHPPHLLEQLSSWSFQPHQLSSDDLFRTACIIFQSMLRLQGLHGVLTIEQLHPFLFALRSTYHQPNAYHNYHHAIDVLQATYSFLVKIKCAPPLNSLNNEANIPWMRPPSTGLASILQPFDLLALLIAAIGHDVGHPGLSNTFMKNARTPVWEIFQDKSVLENMHCVLLVQLLRKHNLGFLLDAKSGSPTSPSHNPHIGTEEVPGMFRRLLSSIVIATDMSLHFDFMKRFEEISHRNMEEGTPSADTITQREEDRILMCCALIKCADISNPARPYSVSEHWSDALIEEWSKQATLEAELFLPVSVATRPDEAGQARSQIGFIDLFVKPLLQVVTLSCPEMSEYERTCSDNRSQWSERLANQQDASAQTSIVSDTIKGKPESFSVQDPRFGDVFPLSIPSYLLPRYQVCPERKSVSSSSGVSAVKKKCSSQRLSWGGHKSAGSM